MAMRPYMFSLVGAGERLRTAELFVRRGGRRITPKRVCHFLPECSMGCCDESFL